MLPSALYIMWPMYKQSLMFLHPTVKEKRHLQENTLLSQGHRRCCAVPSTTSKRLEGNAFTRKYII